MSQGLAIRSDLRESKSVVKIRENKEIHPKLIGRKIRLRIRPIRFERNQKVQPKFPSVEVPWY